jgi:hypothetical protein
MLRSNPSADPGVGVKRCAGTPIGASHLTLHFNTNALNLRGKMPRSPSAPMLNSMSLTPNDQNSNSR